jgi:hypothetical protein
MTRFLATILRQTLRNRKAFPGALAAGRCNLSSEASSSYSQQDPSPVSPDAAKHYDVVICGGGMVGLAAALSLATDPHASDCLKVGHNHRVGHTMKPLYNVPLYNFHLVITLHRGLFLQIQIAWITSPYNVHLLFTYTSCLSQRERYIEVSLWLEAWMKAHCPHQLSLMGP